MAYPIKPAPLSIGVITSLGSDAQQALRTVRDLGLTHAQISYSPSWDTAEGRALVRQASEENSIALTTLFCGFAGESYADIATVHETVGLVPPATRDERLQVIEKISQCAQALEIDRVAAHIGFIPDDAGHEHYPALVEAVRGVCASLQARGQVFSLETGQETAATLQRFIADVGAPNMSVNFDPANMILYANDEPIAATQVLAPWIDGVHCKDGFAPTEPGQLGHEVPFGEGAVDAPRWLATLLATGFRGPLTIEREVHGEEQQAGIRQARELLESLLPTLLASVPTPASR
jgi:sugar phosphate isomerase/epimerase